MNEQQIYDSLDDENSEVYKLGLELSEMTDIEFQENVKKICNVLFRNKKN